VSSLSVSFAVRFRIDLLSSQFLISEFSSIGTVLDISRGGMLTQVDRPLAVGADRVMSRTLFLGAANLPRR